MSKGVSAPSNAPREYHIQEYDRSHFEIFLHLTVTLVLLPAPADHNLLFAIYSRGTTPTLFQRIRAIILAIFLNISPAITSIPRNAFHSHRRMTKGLNEKDAVPDGLLALVNDPEKVKDDIRNQLEGFTNAELERCTRTVRHLLDSTLMPISWLMYFCNHLDRVSDVLVHAYG